MSKFRIETSSGFRRNFKKLLKSHNTVISVYEEVLLVLESDPYNLSKRYDIRKLGGIKHGDGRFRIRLNNWRIRYDIEKYIVILYSFKDRKEGY